VLRTVVAAYRGAFSGVSRPVWLLALATLVNRSGTMVLPFLALFLTERRGFTPAQAGQILALYGAGALGASYLGGWLCDHADAKRVMGVTLAATGLGFLVLGHLESRAAIAVTVFLLSLAGETFRPANAAAIAAAADPAKRAKSFALNRLAVNVGMTLGPAVGGWLALYDYGWLFVADGATCLLAAGLLWRFIQGEKGEGSPATAADGLGASAGAADRSPWRDGPFLVLLLLLFVLATVTFQTVSTYPLTLHRLYHLSEAGVGMILATNTFVIVLFEMVLVHSLAGRNELELVGVGSFLFCLGFGLMPLGSSVAFLVFTVLVWSLGEMLAFPAMAGAVAGRAGESNRGRYMGLFHFAFAAAFVAAPLAGTWVFQRFGSRPLWFGCGLTGLPLWLGCHLLAKAQARERALAGARAAPASGAEAVSP
jgi:predicted MFS family arabinose efflux permease